MPNQVKKFLDDDEAQNIFHNASSLNYLIQEDQICNYACLFLVGGHGCIDDFYGNLDLKEAVEFHYKHVEGCVAAICHGPLGLINCNVKG